MSDAPPKDTRRSIIASGQRIMSRKGYCGVGLNEVLQQAGVPKGSFYHWFPSKEAFGEQMIDAFYESYLENMDRLCEQAELSAGERLGRFFAGWREAQLSDDTTDHCLTTKLGSEVAETHPTLRAALRRGGEAIVDRLERLVGDGVCDGSVQWAASPRVAAEVLFDLWVGAGVRAKIEDDPESLNNARAATDQLLQLSANAHRPAVPHHADSQGSAQQPLSDS